MKRKRPIQKRLLRFLTALLPIILSSCALVQQQSTPNLDYQYPVPEQLDDGWKTAHLSSVGLEETFYIELLNDLENMEDHRLHSLVIIKDGLLVFEEYFPGDKFNLAEFTGETGFDRQDTHNLCSVTKSFTSAILGIAIDQGRIESVHQPVSEFFPELEDNFSDDLWKQELTIEDLLTMRSGIDWDDESTPYLDHRNDMYQLFTNVDPIKYILSKDIVLAPGVTFEYSNCNTNLLGEIIRRASDKRIDEFAEEYLFSRLGIEAVEWQMISPSVVFTSGDLRLRPRDMAKFGYLFLSEGMWGDERIISQHWVQRSTTMHVDLTVGPYHEDWADGYGYQWWIWEDIGGFDVQAYFASGWGGQWIIVMPEINTVVVSTAGNYYSSGTMSIQTILTEYILPSITDQ